MKCRPLFAKTFRFPWSAGSTPDPARQDLIALLAAEGPRPSYDAQAEWLEGIVNWIVSWGSIPRGAYPTLDRGYPPGSRQAHRPEPARTHRLRYFFKVLRDHPDWRLKTATVLRSVLTQGRSLHLLGTTGMPAEHGFLSEAGSRFVNRLLPRPPRDQELSDLLGRLFSTSTDARWIRSLPPVLLLELFYLLEFADPSPGRLARHFQAEISDAMILLASRIAAVGSAEEIRERLPALAFRELPFIALLRASEILADQLALEMPTSGLACLSQIDACRDAIRSVHGHLEKTGVSVSLVYRLDKIESHLARLEVLLGFLVPMEDRGDLSRLPSVGATLIASLVADLIEGGIADRSLRKLVSTNVGALAKKVVERTGHSGEHYITRSRREYFQMLGGAAGGGLVTAFTAIVKFFILSIHAPIFFEFLFNAVNYAASFLVMQTFHFKLATKQPSMTASTLARRIGKKDDPAGFEDFIDEVERITRSQLVAAVGNIVAVIPAAFALDWLCMLFWKRHILSEETAVHAISSLHPFLSLTLPFAVLTGILLWLSSVAAGTIENWAVYNRLPEAIAASPRLTRALGAERTKKLARIFANEISGAASCVSLGILLAATPALGVILGLPLMAPHVTLSSGALGLGSAALAQAGRWEAGFAPALLSILIVGALNFGVSFALALATAIRARDLDGPWVLKLLRGVGQRFLRSPRRFFLPPQDPAPVLIERRAVIRSG